jgi:hypothetical protein
MKTDPLSDLTPAEVAEYRALAHSLAHSDANVRLVALVRRMKQLRKEITAWTRTHGADCTAGVNGGPCVYCGTRNDDGNDLSPDSADDALFVADQLRGVRWAVDTGRSFLESVVRFTGTPAELKAKFARLAKRYPAAGLGGAGEPDEPAAVTAPPCDPDSDQPSYRRRYL